MARRWDTDERGAGVADARALLPEARRLLEAMDAPDWVAEDAEAHLLPHLRRACADARLPLALEDARTAPDGAFVVDLRWTGDTRSLGGPRPAAFALLGAVAEPATYVRERHDDGVFVFEIATGVLAGDGPFAAHGHVVVLRVHGAAP